MSQLPLDQILQGDCIELMRQLPERSVDCIFADPPYNLQLRQELYRPNRTKVDAVDDEWDQFESFEAYDEFTTQWLTEARRVLKDTGTIWVIGSYHNIFRIGKIMQDLGFWILNNIVWIKCLSATTYLYVKTQQGERPMTIKDVTRLSPQSVQLWNGTKWVQVLAWQKQHVAEGCMEIVLRSGERICCSPTHSFPTLRGRVQAKDLQIGDVLQTCQLPEPHPCPKTEGLDDYWVGRFLGLYLAEGSRSEDTIIIASHIKETDRFQFLQAFAERYHGTARIHQTSENGCAVHLNGKILNAIVDTYITGRTAKTKHLTHRCWQRSNDFLRALLDGYLEGDGHFDASNRRWRLGLTRNPQIENDLRTIAARLGISIRLHPYNLKLHEKSYPTLRGQVRLEPCTHPNARNDAEVIAIGRSWSKELWDIAVDDESRMFALASGVLSYNSNPMPNFRGVRFTNAHETLIWAQKRQGNPYTFNYHAMKALNDDLQMRSDWYIPLCTGNERLKVNGEKAHSTQKPEALLYRVILASTKPGDVVLDPFFGTGTTGAVAKRLGRRWIGIEKDPRYVEIARKRIEAVAPAPIETLSVSSQPAKRNRVPFGALVENGYLAPGDTLYFQGDLNRPAQVLANGHIRYHNGVEGSIHAVGKHITGAPCNGWEVWYYRDAATGALLPIDALRKRFLEAVRKPCE